MADLGRHRRPWGIHTVGDMYVPNMHSGMPDGRYARGVCGPYWTIGFGRWRSAWWVLTGRAQAIIWPEPGDLEKALGEPLLERSAITKGADHGG